MIDDVILDLCSKDMLYIDYEKKLKATSIRKHIKDCNSIYQQHKIYLDKVKSALNGNQTYEPMLLGLSEEIAERLLIPEKQKGLQYRLDESRDIIKYLSKEHVACDDTNRQYQEKIRNINEQILSYEKSESMTLGVDKILDASGVAFDQQLYTKEPQKNQILTLKSLEVEAMEKELVLYEKEAYRYGLLAVRYKNKIEIMSGTVAAYETQVDIARQKISLLENRMHNLECIRNRLETYSLNEGLPRFYERFKDAIDGFFSKLSKTPQHTVI